MQAMGSSFFVAMARPCGNTGSTASSGSNHLLRRTERLSDRSARISTRSSATLDPV
jgi:hypothetical protein